MSRPTQFMLETDNLIFIEGDIFLSLVDPVIQYFSPKFIVFVLLCV
jgi:hypothetical protein